MSVVTKTPKTELEERATSIWSMVQAKDDDSSAVPTGTDEDARPRPHVLMIDDEEDLCELVALRLEHNGYRVTTETTARGGLEVIEREVVDAMILDLRLEDADGLEVLRRVVERSSDLPVVVLTAHGTIESAVEAMRLGAYGFLTKPFDGHALLQQLGHAVERVRLRRELEGLKRIFGETTEGSRLLGVSGAIALVRARICRVARTEATVLIQGESGTGKELAARAIHEGSSRAKGPFVAVNCGALPEQLLESELFGYERGAFTGAHRSRSGLIAAAEGGTLFLDEVGEAPLGVQVKLLRVLEERSYLPIGSVAPLAANIRVVTATNRNLQQEVKEGRFREDLYYRLHVVPLVMPPLRESREDIPLLAEYFLTRSAARHRISTPHLTLDAIRVLLGHEWRGNVRELANVIEGASILSQDGYLRPEHVLSVLNPGTDPGVSLRPAPQNLLIVPAWSNVEGPFPSLRKAREAFDRSYLEEVLRKAGGNVSQAARLAGRNRTDLHELLRRHDIRASRFREAKQEL